MSNERDFLFGGPDAEIDVVLEPRGGITDAEVVERLAAAGATEVSVLAPGYVSAKVARAALPDLESVAIARPKVTKQMRRGR